MRKRCVLGSLVLIAAMGIALAFCIGPCFAEDITITTYYPAPFGVYNEMRANKLVIGDPDSTSTPSPDTDGVVRFKGIGSDPIGAGDTEPGALYYNTSDDEFKYHDGTGWQTLGGGTQYIVTTRATDSTTCTSYPAAFCPTADWTEEASWNYCTRAKDAGIGAWNAWTQTLCSK